jgi:hypothetical protein
MLLHDCKHALLRRYEYINGLEYYEPLRHKIQYNTYNTKHNGFSHERLPHTLNYY